MKINWIKSIQDQLTVWEFFNGEELAKVCKIYLQATLSLESFLNIR
jgi:hypothetical protein